MRNEELAKYFDIADSTLQLWIAAHEEFSEAISEGREAADSNVAQSLYNKALAGDTRAIRFWLGNRNADRWRERQEIEVTSDADALTARLLAGRIRSRKPEESKGE